MARYKDYDYSQEGNVGSDLIIEFSEMTPNRLLLNERLHRIADKAGSREAFASGAGEINEK